MTKLTSTERKKLLNEALQNLKRAQELLDEVRVKHEAAMKTVNRLEGDTHE